MFRILSAESDRVGPANFILLDIGPYIVSRHRLLPLRFIVPLSMIPVSRFQFSEQSFLSQSGPILINLHIPFRHTPDHPLQEALRLGRRLAPTNHATA